MSTQTDVQSVVDVDLDKELPCESTLISCNNEAEWVVIHPCKCRGLLCNLCAIEQIKRVKLYAHSHIFMCNFCTSYFDGNDIKLVKI